MASLKEAFKVRQLPESEEYIITIGNHLATEEKFKSAKAAQMQINKTNWDSVNWEKSFEKYFSLIPVEADGEMLARSMGVSDAVLNVQKSKVREYPERIIVGL